MNPLVVKWVLIGLVLASAFGAGWKVNGDRWEKKYQTLQAEYDQFKGGVAALGEAAKVKAKKEATANKLAQRRANEQNTSTITTLRADVERLRNDRDRAGGGRVPPAPAGTIRPDLACFDRASLESALGKLIGDVRGLADEGSQATIDLDTGKNWIKSLQGASP